MKRNEFLSVTDLSTGNRLLTRYTHVEFREGHSIVHLSGGGVITVRELEDDLWRQLRRASMGETKSYRLTLVLLGTFIGWILRDLNVLLSPLWR